MKSLKTVLLFLIAGMIISASGVQVRTVAGTMPAPFRILPEPVNTEMLKGKGIRFDDLQFLVLENDIKRPVMGELLSLLPDKGKGKGSLSLRIDNKQVPASKEGYVLTIINGNAEIIAPGEAGIFYGCQTLEQLLEDARDFNVPVPACRITDYPALAYRSVHFDVKHHLDNMDYYYHSIDRLARYKINAIIFEFEDKLRYERQPLVGAPQAISIDEMAALTKYASERHIEISPLVQGLGHATFILKHEEYAHLRELPYNRWAFCPLNEGTYQVLFDLYRDAIKATPGSRYLHVGGDETGNIGLCPRCKPTADKEGMLSLNLYWLKRVCEFAEENGRIPIFWDDMPLKEGGVYETTYKNIDKEKAAEIWKTGKNKLNEVISDFPKKCIYMRWNYNSGREAGNIMALDWYREHGLKVMVATAAQSGASALFPADDRDSTSMNGIAAIKSFTELAAEKETEGMLCTAWDDRSPHMETYWRGFIASAEYSWSPGRRSLDSFDEAYLQREYAVSRPDFAELYKRLEEGARFWETAYVKTGNRMDMENALFNLPGLAHWLPPKKPGSPVRVDFTDILIDLPDLQSPGSWSKQYAGRLAEAEKVYDEYAAIGHELDELYKASKRNRYHWLLFSALNDFQVTAPRILLAIEKYDKAASARKSEELNGVKEAMKDFYKAWENLKDVYSTTRFISYPDTYVPDRYFHFASQREDLTWIIQDEELFLSELSEWMKANQKM